MIYIRTRSGRFISRDQIIGFAIEDQKFETDGKRKTVYNIIAYMPEHLYPAILGIYENYATAETHLEKFMEELVKTEKGIVSVQTEI